MILDKFCLNGKNALVTDRAVAWVRRSRLPWHKPGANVACHGRSEEGKKTSERIRQLGRNSVYLAGDFAKREVQTELIKKARGTWINRHSCE
jgi:hypothetical protein